MNINDDVTLICPFYDVGFVQPETSLETPIYENIYFLGENKTAYDECDATGKFSCLLKTLIISKGPI